MVKLFSGIAHNSCSEDRALQTSRKRVVTVSKACVTPLMLPGTTTITSTVTVKNIRIDFRLLEFLAQNASTHFRTGTSATATHGLEYPVGENKPAAQAGL